MDQYNSGRYWTNKCDLYGAKGNYFNFTYDSLYKGSQYKCIGLPIRAILDTNKPSKYCTKEEIDTKVADIDKIKGDLYGSFADLQVGDIILADNNTEELTYCNADNLEQYRHTHTPIGIVVIPTSHDVYGTGEAGVISFDYMDYETP